MALAMPFLHKSARGVAMSLIKRLFKPPKQSYFLFGPRGTGKTTLIKTLYHDALRIDLLNPGTLRRYLAKPEQLYQTISGYPNKKTIVIDEVQKAPELLSVVHDLIETDKTLQFILTGSSSRKLKKEGVNLLGGRALKKHLYPFIASELGAQFSLEQAIINGTLPLVIETENPHETLEAYLELYIQEEVRNEGLVRNMENFARFLEAISFSHGTVISLTNIARESEVKRKTVENYISILEDLLIAFQLPVFSHQATRNLISHQKFYLFDAGVFQVLRPKLFGDGPATHTGPALEGLVASHLLAWTNYRNDHNTLSYWRTRTGLEVDFVLYSETYFFAVEVKNADKINAKDCKGLQAFLSDYPLATAILLYRGHTRMKLGDIWCIPCTEFLTELTPDIAIEDILKI
jgi:uncharacterized protein